MPRPSLEVLKKTFKSGHCQRCGTKSAAMKSVKHKGDGKVAVGKANESSHYCPDCTDIRKRELSGGTGTKRPRQKADAGKAKTTKAKAKPRKKVRRKKTAAKAEQSVPAVDPF